MNIDDAFPSKYLKAEDLNGKPYTLTMREVCMLEIDEGREKAVLFFAESQKGLVLNQTNTNVIKSLFTKYTEQWAGKKIVVYPAQTDFRGKIVPCIRVRAVESCPASG
jgi:hypothetical protein